MKDQAPDSLPNIIPEQSQRKEDTSNSQTPPPPQDSAPQALPETLNTSAPEKEDAPLTPQQLQAWEDALNIKERKLSACDELKRRGLPLNLLEHLDFTSDTALKQGLALALAAAQPLGDPDHASRPLIPREAPPLSNPSAGYRERVQLYLIDQPGYMETYHANNQQ